MPLPQDCIRNRELNSFLSREMPSELAQFLSLGKSPKGLQSFLDIANLDICQVFQTLVLRKTEEWGKKLYSTTKFSRAPILAVGSENNIAKSFEYQKSET